MYALDTRHQVVVSHAEKRPGCEYTSNQPTGVPAYLAVRQIRILRLELRRHVSPLKAVRVRLLPCRTPLLHLRPAHSTM